MKVIVVTGAFGALGQAVVSRLVADGATVCAIDAASEAAVPGAGLVLGNIDTADPNAATQAVSRIIETFGGVDGLVNIAGGFRWETIADGSVETWDALYRTNVRTALVMSQAALSALTERGGSVVNVGANAAIKAGAGMGAYAASKAGVARLTEALAEESKDLGVRINAVLPGILDTPANRADMPDAEFGRWVAPEALASVIAFLLSSEAAAVTGALVPVTGRV